MAVKLNRSSYELPQDAELGAGMTMEPLAPWLLDGDHGLVEAG
jgi:hypothetical protein